MDNSSRCGFMHKGIWKCGQLEYHSVHAVSNLAHHTFEPEPISGAASTEEPPHDIAHPRNAENLFMAWLATHKCPCGCKLCGDTIMFLDSLREAARPSEPSAPKAEPPKYWQCPNNESHHLRFGEKVYGTQHYRQYCIHCPDTVAVFRAKPTAPDPVAGTQVEPLRMSFDIGGVLSKYPEVFRPMVTALQRGGVEVYVITDMHEHEKSVRFVRENGYDIPAERILNSDYLVWGELCKARTIHENRIQLHVDDFAGYCAHNGCVNLFVWPNPQKPYYADDFKTDGSEGDFGRRKASKI